MTPESSTRPSLVLWGSPLDKGYRSLVRELRVLAGGKIAIVHRHHAFEHVGADEAFECAEAVEVATLFRARHAALTWFFSHGILGLLPPHLMAEQWSLDAREFERAYFEGLGREAVERDLRAARRLGLIDDTSATIRGVPFTGKLTAEALIAACKKAGEEATAATGSR
ncbi:MAG: hypothetical protein HOW73_46145 [Polyangiaceae bacterium]|nr:hypothetical protein [Polyangiaceae bacterium]